jgi:HtrA serine peptidase 2
MSPVARRTVRLLGISSGIGLGAGIASLQTVSLFKPHLKTVHAKALVDNMDATGPGSLRGRWNFIADVVDKVAPAVVYIEIQGRHPYTGQMMAVSNGSGFIVRSDGLILTNAHVVGNNATVRVQLHDGQSFEGRVQAVDPVSDLATVYISASNLPTIKLGKSSDLRPGEWVVAMGSPFKLSNTVTAGIVSSVQRGSRELGLHHKDMDYIQTDANVNFGNSGGPLINLDGEAIGINTMKVTAGISFAIPSDYAHKFLEKAKTIEKRSESKGWFGVPVRRYIGVTMLSLTPEIVAEMRMRQSNFPDVDYGVLVYRVIVGSPAYNGGLRPGDIITKINDEEVKSASDVYAAVEKSKTLKLSVQRGTEATITFTVTPEVVK